MQPNLDKLMVLNIGFLLLWASFNTSQSLAGQVLTDNGFGELGFYSLSELYFMRCVCCFFTTPIVKKCGIRTSLLFGGLTSALFVATFIQPAFRSELTHNQQIPWYLTTSAIWTVMMVIAAINGIGQSCMWVGAGNYISLCANEQNKGLFNSLFWCFLMTSGIVGNLMAAFVIAGVKLSVFYMVMTGCALLCNVCFLLIMMPKQDTVGQEVSLGASVKDSVVEQEQQQSVKKDIVETMTLFIKPRMMLLAPIWMWTAVSNATLSGVFIALWTDTIKHTPGKADWHADHSRKMCLLAFVAWGCGEIVGSLAFGQICDRFTNKTTAIVCSICSILAVICCFVFTLEYQFTFWFACLMAFMWGIQDSMSQCFCQTLCGFQFDSKTTPFSVFQLCQNFAAFFLYALDGLLLKNKQDYVWYFIGVFCFAILTYTLLIFKFQFRENMEHQADFKRQNI